MRMHGMIAGNNPIIRGTSVIIGRLVHHPRTHYPVGFGIGVGSRPVGTRQNHSSMLAERDIVNSGMHELICA